MVAQNLFQLKSKIEGIAGKCDRDPKDIKLIAVTKTHSVDRIRKAVDAGHCVYGESRVQEAQNKIPCFEENLSWHLIGHLQKNKAKYAVRLFDLIHSVDSVELAEVISRRAMLENKKQNILLQVNVSGELSKFGFSPELIPAVIDQLVSLPGIRLNGLMTIPPFFPDPETARPYFRHLRELAKQLQSRNWPSESKMELSMGMSGDYGVAIEEGATMVRVGTAVFGER